MSLGSIVIVERMNELMLEYADDIVPVDRHKVVDVFKKINIPCREDYIDFLARFGGNKSKMFQTFEFDCTFKEICEIYLEEPDDELPSKGYCVIGNQLMSDFFIIENETGRIYNEKYDIKHNLILDKIEFDSISVFLWRMLYNTYSDNFIKDSTLIQDKETLNNIYSKNGALLFNYANCSGRYYLEENKIYIYYEDKGEFYIHTLSDSFITELYR